MVPVLLWGWKVNAGWLLTLSLVCQFRVEVGEEAVDKFVRDMGVTGTDSVERTGQQEALAGEHAVHVGTPGFDVVDGVHQFDFVGGEGWVGSHDDPFCVGSRDCWATNNPVAEGILPPLL